MIKILGTTTQPQTIINEYPPNSIERRIISMMSSNNQIYVYDSIKQLKFEVDLRKHIIGAAKDLHRSNFSFKVFRKSKCNMHYWERTAEGGFLLKNNAKPTDAIRDIYINSSKYGTECSTAIVIVFYKALLDMFPEELFNQLFTNIYLMDWQHLDSDLGIYTYRNEGGYLPGDCRYFKNPDVDPLTPEWQGENAIDLGDGFYYGHGIGIQTADGIINALNNHRIAGSEQPAYLMDLATRPAFKYLAEKYNNFISRLHIVRYRRYPRYLRMRKR